MSTLCSDRVTSNDSKIEIRVMLCFIIINILSHSLRLYWLWNEIWVWSVGQITLVGQNQSTWGETCPTTTFATTKLHMNCPRIEPKPLQLETV